MKTLKDIPEMARTNAEMAIDQRCGYDDSIASFAQNVRDTMNDWGIEPGPHRADALACYYEHVARLLYASAERTRRADRMFRDARGSK